jgi:polyphosphate glucokinase
VAQEGDAMSDTPARPFTLAIDVGGTGLKAAVLDAGGAMVADRVRVPTTYPCPPDRLVEILAELTAPLPAFDRVAAGFPGMVRGGRVLSASHFQTSAGPGSDEDPALVASWRGFDLRDALEQRFGKPTKVANDADVQGAAVVVGEGLELVVTLGTGVGTAFFFEGRLMPHLEFSHHPLYKEDTYNEQLGDRARKEVGNEKWNRRVRRAIGTLRALCFFDHCYLGGGNAKRLEGELPEDVTIVDNTAGLLGGLKLWTGDHVGLG